MSETALSYQPFYCEENIWQLAQRSDVIAHPAEVVFISNASRQVACWEQRAADPGEAVVWDYHVVLAEHAPEGWRVWDLDSRLGFPRPAAAWLEATFQLPSRVRPAYHPRFRVAPSALFVATFASDRSHMRRADGGWHHPPPPWAPPGAPAMNLPSWIDTSAPEGPGEVLDRAALERRWDLVPVP